MPQYDHRNQSAFSFLLKSDWYSATGLQDLLKSMKQDIFDKNSDDATRIMDYQQRFWKRTLEINCLVPPPFGLQMRFRNNMEGSSGDQKAEGLYICESVGSWAPLLNQFEFSLSKEVKPENAARDLEALISIVNQMEEKLREMNGVLNRQVFEETFKFKWVDPSQVTACSK